jgi:hypothetical protein
MPMAWCLADPKIGEREVAEGLLAHARGTGALEHYAADQVKVLLARPDRKDEEKRRFSNLAGMRQWIEAIFDTLKDQLALDAPQPGSTPASPSGYWPWPHASGTTGRPELTRNDP